jgi:hypothetical protein
MPELFKFKIISVLVVCLIYLVLLKRSETERLFLITEQLHVFLSKITFKS